MPLELSNIGNGLAPLMQHIPTICEIKGVDLFLYLLLPLLIGLMLGLIFAFRETIKIKWFKMYSNKGYIKILMIRENKKIISKIVKLDKFNNFKFPTIKDRKYSLEKMYDFIIGYDGFGFPIFMFDINFILPLKITALSVADEIRKQLGITDAKKISAVTMKLDSSIYHTVYDKKLISDLYSISGSSSTAKMIMWIIIIGGGLLVMYYTGLLDKLLSIVGVHGFAPPVNAVNATAAVKK